MKHLNTILAFLICLGFAVQAEARSLSNTFDDRLTYDIYFYSGENHTSVLEDIDIEGMREIGGKEFLVLNSKGFKLTEEAGYILFDAVIAILPSRHFKVRKTDSIQFRHHR